MKEIYKQHVRSMARTHDYETYLCSRVAPKQLQPRLWLISALDHELARIPSVTQEETIRMIRFTWWRETVEEAMAGKPARQHEVAEPLSALLQTQPELPSLVQKMLESRAAWLFEEGDVAQCHAAKWAAIAHLLGEKPEVGARYGQLYALQWPLRSGETALADEAALQTLDDAIFAVHRCTNLTSFLLLRYMLVTNQKRLRVAISKGITPLLQRPSFSAYAYAAYVAMRKN